MKAILILTILLLPPYIFGQTFKYDDSLFLRLIKKFKIDFLIDDTLGIQNKNEAKEYLKELDEQLKSKVFTTAKVVSGFRYTNDYGSKKITFGVLEFELVNLNDADLAYSKLNAKKFDDTWDYYEMFSCTKRKKNRIIFIYSPSVLIKNMKSFMGEICQP